MKATGNIGGLRRVRALMATVVLGVLFMASQARANANAVYVATNATPAAPYDTWDIAFTNVQDALDWAAASGGDTNKIYLAGHTFWLTNQIVWTTEGLTVRGGHAATNAADQPGPSDPRQWPTILAGSGDDHRIMLIDTADNGALEAVTLTGGKVREGSALSIRNSVNVRISGCTLEENHFTQVVSTGIETPALFLDSSIVAISNSVIRNNSGGNARDNSNSDQAYGGGVAGNGTLTIEDSQILNNTVSIARHGAHVRGGGIYFEGNLSMRNVLLTGNRVTGGTQPLNRGGDGLWLVDGTADIAHCSIIFHAGEGIRNESGVITMTDCIVRGNFKNIVGGSVTANYSNIGDADYQSYGVGNINADPLFEYGYYLADGSPSAGTGSGTAADLDMEGYIRNAGGDVYEAGHTVNMGYHYPSGFDIVYPDLYVATDGEDANAGTDPAEALKSVTKALSLAHAGTRIHVATGVYSTATTGEQFPLVVTDKPGLQILGTNAAATVLDGGNEGERILKFRNSPLNAVEQLAITGGQALDRVGGSALLVENCQEFLFSGCIVEENHFGLNVGATIFTSAIRAIASSVTMQEAIVRNNSGQQENNSTNSRHAYGGGIASDGNLWLLNSIVASNEASNARSGAAVRGGGIYYAAFRNDTALTMKNVLLANNSSEGTPTVRVGDNLYVSGGGYNGQTHVFLWNCTVADGDGEGIRVDSGTVSLLNCIVWNNGDNLVGDFADVAYSNIEGATVYPGEGNINADPLFVAAAEGDYRLQSGSPASDTGMNQAWMVGTVDLDGNPQILMGIVDMGCYETIPPAGTLFFMR